MGEYSIYNVVGVKNNKNTTETAKKIQLLWSRCPYGPPSPELVGSLRYVMNEVLDNELNEFQLSHAIMFIFGLILLGKVLNAPIG